MDREARQRVFFALWPDAVGAAALAALGRQAQARTGGRAMALDTLHLTLAFIGAVDATQLAQLQCIGRQLGRELAPLAFDLILDRLDCWRHNHIVWAGASRLPDEVANLAGQLAARLTAAGFVLDKRPFSAHVTLLRNARCDSPLPAMAPLTWPVTGFALLRSRLDQAGARYEVLGRYGLTTDT